MFYRLTAPKPFVVRVSPLAATAVEERLRAAALHFHSEIEQDAREGRPAQRVPRRAGDQSVGPVQAGLPRVT